MCPNKTRVWVGRMKMKMRKNEENKLLHRIILNLINVSFFPLHIVHICEKNYCCGKDLQISVNIFNLSMSRAIMNKFHPRSLLEPLRV